MDWKKFLQPDLKKIILFIALFIIGTLFWPKPLALDVNYFGGPLVFASVGTLPCPPGTPYPCHMPIINYFNLIIDIIFWYLIACGIIFAYNKYKKK